MKKQLHQINSLRSTYTVRQKGMVVFCIWALILCATLPFLSIGSFDGEASATYTLFSTSYLLKTTLLIVLIFAFLLAWNASPWWKQKVHQFVGFKDNDGLMNAWALLAVLVALLAVGDTLTLLQQTFSFRIEWGRGLFVLQLYMLAGLIWNLLLARYEHNQKRSSHEVTISHEHDERSKDAFKHVEKEFGALFGRDE